VRERVRVRGAEGGTRAPNSPTGRNYGLKRWPWSRRRSWQRSTSRNTSQFPCSRRTTPTP
jgi:hypothetical protein